VSDPNRGSKVALIGNMNNNFFALARYLRDAGIDAELLLIDGELPHFHPSKDTFDLDYQRYTRTLTWGSVERFRSTPDAVVRQDLEPFGFLIVCGAVPAYLHRAGRRADVFVPYGDDLGDMPWIAPPHCGPREVSWRARQWRFHLAQRRGIADAALVNFNAGNDRARWQVRTLGIEGSTRYLGVPLVYAPPYRCGSDELGESRSAWSHEFRSVRSSVDLMVFHHSRHIWTTYVNDYSWKGNDVLVRGIARVRGTRPTVSIGLVCLEYGPDVGASRELAGSLGISDVLHWFPQMDRKEVLLGLAMADVASGHFAMGDAGCGAVYEGLALGRPLVHYRDDLHPQGQLDYPFLPARTEEDVEVALRWALDHPTELHELGRRAVRWYDDRFVASSLDGLIDLIDRAVSNRGDRGGE
jgi:hypothetical protein